jgi:Holliday junction DNA helicase RuvA
MIAYLEGKAMNKQEKTLTLNVNGVGYLVNMPKSILEKIEDGQTLALHIHTNVREDDISLFGFQTKEDLQFYKLLISVSGVGPKTALEIMNAPINKTRKAIAQRDVAHLTLTPGIGKKTAERIIIDLEGKIKADFLEETDSETGNKPAASEDIVQALVQLGYHRQHVLDGLKKIPTEIAGEEAIIKYFLQNS